MDAQTTKIELVKMILNIENDEFIQKVTDFINDIETTDFWDDLSEDEQMEIKEGIRELNKGERVPYEEFLIQDKTRIN
jgi:hypothetical protein